MTIKIVGFKVGRDRSTCYYKVEIEGLEVREINEKLGIAMRKASRITVIPGRTDLEVIFILILFYAKGVIRLAKMMSPKKTS